MGSRDQQEIGNLDTVHRPPSSKFSSNDLELLHHLPLHVLYPNGISAKELEQHWAQEEKIMNAPNTAKQGRMVSTMHISITFPPQRTWTQSIMSLFSLSPDPDPRSSSGWDYVVGSYGTVLDLIEYLSVQLYSLLEALPMVRSIEEATGIIKAFHRINKLMNPRIGPMSYEETLVHLEQAADDAERFEFWGAPFGRQPGPERIEKIVDEQLQLRTELERLREAQKQCAAREDHIRKLEGAVVAMKKDASMWQDKWSGTGVQPEGTEPIATAPDHGLRTDASLDATVKAHHTIMARMTTKHEQLQWNLASLEAHTGLPPSKRGVHE